MDLAVAGHFFRRVTPWAVWLTAIGGVVYVWRDGLHGGQLPGYAEAKSTAICHLEPAVIRRVRVSLHEWVVPGQILVELDDRDERLRLSVIEADVERLKAEVGAERSRIAAENARAGTDQEDLERRFLWDRETARLEYLALLVQDAADRAELGGARIEHEIVRELHKEKNANFRELNAIETTVNRLDARVDRNKEEIAAAKEQFDAADRRWSLFTERSTGTVAVDAVLEPLRLAADVRQRELEEVRHRIEGLVLRAPFAGQITAIYAEEKAHVQAGAPIVTVSPSSTNRVLAYLPQDSVFAVSEGAHVLVRRLAITDLQDSQIPGRVTSVAAMVDEQPPRTWKLPTVPRWGREIVIALDGPAKLIPGESVSVSLGQVP